MPRSIVGRDENRRGDRDRAVWVLGDLMRAEIRSEVVRGPSEPVSVHVAPVLSRCLRVPIIGSGGRSGIVPRSAVGEAYRSINEHSSGLEGIAQSRVELDFQGYEPRVRPFHYRAG